MKYAALFLSLTIGVSVALENSSIPLNGTENFAKRKSPAMSSVLEANKKLSNQLFNILAEMRNDSLVYSPISLSAALTTLFVGADLVTAREIKRGLNYQDIPDVLINHEFAEILSILQQNDVSIVKLFTTILISPEFAISVPFENVVQEQFFGKILPLNLNDSKEYISVVNDIVSKFTNGRIETLLTEVDTLPSAKAVLLNTMHFKSEWDRAFTPLLTQKRPFFTIDGEEIEVDMMLRGGDYPFAEIPELNSSALSIPYKGNRLSFTIVLPEREIDIKELEENLQNFPMTSIMGRLSVQYIQLSMPKFKIDSAVDFVKTETLQKIGIKSMLSPQEATFNKISSDQGLYVSSILQSSHIDVQEGGTEAEASNFVEAVPASFRYLTPFTVDRPFIFFIYDRVADCILLVGRKVR